MSNPTEDEIRQIVQQVLARMVNSSVAIAPAAPPPVAPQPAPPKPPEAGPALKVVAIGADHGGFELKETLKPHIAALGYEVVDVGTNSKEAVDYPDFAHEVAIRVASGKAWRGIVIDGAGIGSCMVANKVPGVRAALAYDYASASNSREHNDANVLTLGAGLIGVNLARQIVQVWLATAFGGGRHERRISKILEIEKRYLK
jgi:ribose 5-phosphate isomerase B